VNDYVSIEVTPAPAQHELSMWDVVEWFDGDETLLGFDYAHAELVGAVPAKEMGR